MNEKFKKLWILFKQLFYGYIAGKYYCQISDLEANMVNLWIKKVPEDFFLLTGGTTLQFSLVLRQYNMSASHKPFLEWMSSAKRSLEWGKRLYLFCQLFNKLSQLLVKLRHLFCATLENWHTRFVSNNDTLITICILWWISFPSGLTMFTLLDQCDFFHLWLIVELQISRYVMSSRDSVLICLISK